MGRREGVGGVRVRARGHTCACVHAHVHTGTGLCGCLAGRRTGDAKGPRAAGSQRPLRPACPPAGTASLRPPRIAPVT